MSLAPKMKMRAIITNNAGHPKAIIAVINTIINASVKNCAINISFSC